MKKFRQTLKGMVSSMKKFWQTLKGMVSSMDKSAKEGADGEAASRTLRYQKERGPSRSL